MARIPYPLVDGLQEPERSYVYANFEDLDRRLTTLESVLGGVVLMWAGQIGDIPSGWQLADGTNGTRDLRDRFVVCAGGAYGVGATGGANTVALTVAQLALHGHGNDGLHAHGGQVTTTGSDHRHTPEGGGNFVANFGANGGANVTTGGGGYQLNPFTNNGGSHPHGINTDGLHAHNTAGLGEAHENRPPYYALAFIQQPA